MDLAAIPFFLLSHIAEVRGAFWHFTVWAFGLLDE